MAKLYNTTQTFNVSINDDQTSETPDQIMGDRTAFFYGTLMAKEVLFNVIFGISSHSRFAVQTITQTPAVLHDHKRSRVRFADYPAVIPCSSHSVRGTYVTGLTDGDIYRLNTFEGGDYRLSNVRVRLLKEEGDESTGEGNVEGEEVETQTYIWIGREDNLEDKEWDYAAFRKEKLAKWSGGEPQEQGWDDGDEKDSTGGRFGQGDIAQALDKLHKQMADDEEPLKSAV